MSFSLMVFFLAYDGDECLKLSGHERMNDK